LAGSYLKSLQLAKQLEERAKEASKNKELAEKDHEALLQFLKKCRESNVDLSEVEKPQRDFEISMASKDYQSAVAHARKALDAAKAAYLRKIGEVADSVDALLAMIQGSGTETKGATDLLEKSKERVVADDLEGAMRLAKNAYDVAERALHELFSELLSQAQETMMQAKDMGEDISIYEDQLARSKTALENQEYATCMSLLKEALEGAGEDLKVQVNSAISRAEELVSAGEELGADMAKVKLHMDRARSSIESLKFKEALSYAKRAEAEGENTISSKFQERFRETRESIKKMKATKEDMSIPQQLLDQAQGALKEKKYIEALHALSTAHERVHQVQFNSVLEVISQARDRFVLAKKVGVDMTKAIMLLNTARDNLKLGKFEDAMNYAEQSRKEVDDALEMFYKARDQIVDLAKAAKFVADLGADAAGVRAILTDARKFFEDKDYANTIDATKRGLAETKKFSHDKTMAAIDRSDKAVKLGKEVGADVTEAEGVLQRAFESMSKGDMVTAVDLANSSLEAANAAMTRTVSDRLQSIDQFVNGYSGEADIREIRELLTDARQQVASFQFGDAYNLIKQVTQRLEAIGQDECDRVIALAVGRIGVVKSVGGDAADLEILLTRARDALSRKIYEDATARAREVIEHADEVMVKMLQAEFSSIKDTLEEAKTIGIDTDEARTILKDAKTKADAREYNEAFRITREANSFLQSRIARYDGIKDKIRRTEELIVEANKTKADVSPILRDLDKARNSFSSGHFDAAEELLDRCIEGAERNLGMYLAAKFILSSKEGLDLAQAHAIDVEAPAKLLAKAKELMKAKNYEEALAFSKRADEEIKKVIFSAITDMTKSLQRLITDARNVGVDTTGPEKLSEKALELARKADYAEALRCIASAKEDINLVKNLSSQAAVEIRVARGNLKDAETLDMDVGRAREFLDQAVEALTRHQYAIALELARKSSDVSSEVTKSRIHETLEKFKERLEKAASEGLSLGMAERCVAEGFQAFKEGRYQESLKLAMKCESEMERAELQRDISTRAVEMARKKLDEAVAEGISGAHMTALVEKAEQLLGQGKYVEAMTAAIESGDEVHLVRESLDSTRIEISAVRERVDRLKKVGIDTSECDEILEMAQDHISEQDFERTKEAIMRASDKAADLFERSIRDVMEQNKQMISKAKSMGINTKACEDLLEVANTSFSEKLWDFAYQQAMACRDSCLGLISKKLSGLVEEVNSKKGTLKRLGASVKQIDDMIEAAKRADAAGDTAAAFQILMTADMKMTGLEDAHKKYLDITIAAESAMETLGRFGLARREPERLMAMAEIEREKDYDSAIELAAEALDTAKNLMEAYSPDISGSLSAVGVQDGAESDATVTLRNTGRALARDITLRVEGDFDVVDSPSVSTLKPGSEEQVGLKLVPRRSGAVPIKLTVLAKRQLDGRMLSFEIEDVLNVFEAGPPFKMGRATDITRCISCQGRIKPGFDIVTCRCGGQLHLSCAKRTGMCPVCSQKYKF